MKKTLLAVLAFATFSTIYAQETFTKPEQTEFYEPVPPVVTPAAAFAGAPSDAIVLFDGKSFTEWQSDKDGSAAKWTLNSDGSMTVKGGAGDIKTKRVFNDFQLHVEWRSPIEPDSLTGQRKGNSGIFLQEKYELQVLNCYQNKTYTNGQTGSIYKQTPPMANACAKMGNWNYYDILYTAPVFRKNGTMEKQPYVTVIHNGIYVQNHTAIQGTTEYIGTPKAVVHGKGGIKLQDHGNQVSYRNIWIREL